MPGPRRGGIGTAARTAAVSVLACALLAGCDQPEPPPLVPRDVPAAEVVDPAVPCTREAAAGAADTAPAPAGSRAVFDRAAGRIVVSAGELSLPALSRLVKNPAALRETAPGEWLLGADLEIGPGASVVVTAPAVRRLNLTSAPGRFVAVRALGGKLAVTGTCVTSWDPGVGKADTASADGRSFLLARDGATMTIDRSELRFLGFGEVESYGLSWRTAGTTGRVTDTIISNLHYGVYSFEVGGLVVTGNEVFASTVYGIDPHTSSHDMTITKNVVHGNGKHGIILAEDCVNSVISDNVVYANGQHGIVLYQRSNGNTVERNESFRNGSQGINVNESSGNTIRGNKVYDNTESGIAVAQSSQDNVLEGNDVRSNRQDGVRLVSRARGTTVRDNVIGQNLRYGVYLDITDPFTLSGNTIFRSRYGISTSGTADVPSGDNTLFGNTDGDVRLPK